MALSTVTTLLCKTRWGALERLVLRLRRLWPNQLGVSSVQFALVVPALVATVMGTVDMGRMLLVQNTLVHAANEATRFAMVRSATSDHVASEEDIVGLVKGRMLGLNTTQAIVSVNWIPENLPGARITVNVDYPYTLSALGLGTIDLNGSSSTFITH